MSNYRKIDDEAVDMFRVLANPNRLEILRRILADCCSRVECGLPGADSCIGSLAADMDIGAPTVSHHIRELRQAGLIRVEQHGQKRYCYAEKDRLRILAEFLDGLARSGEGEDVP